MTAGRASTLAEEIAAADAADKARIVPAEDDPNPDEMVSPWVSPEAVEPRRTT